MSDDERTALPIHGFCEDYDLHLPPTSGQQYLHRVMEEARQCPGVVVANIDTKGFLHKQTLKVSNDSGVMKAPAGYAPSVAWQVKQAADFSHLRQKLARYKARLKVKKTKANAKLPSKTNVTAWCQLSLGRLQPCSSDPMPSPTCPEQCSSMSPGGAPATKVDETVNREETTPASNGRSPPLLSIISSMDQPTVLKVLEYHVNWFEATGFSNEQGEWLYALLVSLEKPLDPEACSLLRQLARNCSLLRATLSSPDHQFLGPMNLFICLVARYFDQKDLADDG